MVANFNKLISRSSESNSSVLNDARDRRDSLTARLAAAEELLSARTAEATAIALEGISDAALDNAEAARREVIGRIDTLQSALRKANELVAALEAEVQAEDQLRQREQAIRATEALATEIEAAQQPLINTLREMASLMKRAEPIVWQANRVACACEFLAAELISAQNGAIQQLRHHAAEMLAGYRETKAPRVGAHEQK